MSLVITSWSGVRAGAFFLAAALLAGFPGTAAAQDKSITIKLATATLNDAQHEWMKRFAVAIDKTANGRIKSEIYPASQLGAVPRPCGPQGQENPRARFALPDRADRETWRNRYSAQPQRRAARAPAGNDRRHVFGDTGFHDAPV